MKTLLPIQAAHAEFLSTRRFAGDFSGMGTGKTITSIDAFRRTGASRLLVIAPPIALHMWAQELGAETDAVVDILRTGKTPLLRTQELRAVVCSYEIATKRAAELTDWLSAYGPSALICDEAHALKSVTAKRTRAILGRGGIAGAADYAWMLTGTPVTRWNDDLFPFLCRADMDGLKQRVGGSATLDRFRLQYTYTQRKQWPGARYPVTMTVGSKNTDQLRDWLYAGASPLAVRRVLDDVVADMPPLTKNNYTIGLDADAELRSVLKDVEKKSISQLAEGLQNKEPALATLRRRIGAAKVRDAAKYIIEQVEDGAISMSSPVLVGAWHTEVIDALTAALNGAGVAVGVIDGRTPATRRATLQDEFNANQLTVLVGQISAMGVSLNLQQGGCRIITVEEDWSPAVMEQFFARLHRMGQKHTVHVDRLVAPLKLEEAVIRLQSRKAGQHAILNDHSEG